MAKKRVASMNKKQKTAWGKIWDFLWNSDSILSWIADLILLYILVKWIFFPTLGFFLSTSMPSLIVESESMIHQGDFDEWWRNYGWWYTEHNITKAEVEKWPYHNGINKGDIVVLKGAKNLNIGDVIIFDVGQRVPIIHRVIKNDTAISTKGDNNQGQLSVEGSIPKKQIIGKTIARIPKLGWAKLFFVDIFRGIFK
jgi:signal peptidase I